MADVQANKHTPSFLLTLSSYRHLIAPLVGLAIFAAAILVLHHLAAEISWQAVKADITGLSYKVLFASLGATIVSFIAFSLYDVLALRSAAPSIVPARVAMMAGAIGYAVSNLIGFSYITGPAVRTRIYSAYGIDLAIIASIVASVWVFFWTGIILLIGLLLLLHPTGIPILQELAPVFQRLLAVFILLSVGAFLFWLSKGQRVFAFRSISIPLPDMKVAVSQIAVGMADIAASSFALYILLPPDFAVGFPLFFVVYVGAIGLGILSHSPGGIGVFEASIVAGLGAAGRSDVLAALVIYRVIYYVLPFAIASLSLGFIWAATNKTSISTQGRQVHRIVGTLIPTLSAGLTLLAGIILLVSGNLPGEASRLKGLEAVLPLPLIEVSHLLASIIGVVLIVLARGLYRKQFKAWLFTIGFLAMGAILSLAKGFDWEEAFVLSFAIATLFMFRTAFYRSANQSVFVLSPRWLLVSVSVFGLAVWIGLFAYSHVEYSSDLWWRFAWNGDAPRYLRATLAAGVVLTAFGINSLINSNGKRAPAETIPDSVRRIIAASDNAEANIHLTGDKRFLVSPDQTTFLGYADTGRSLIAKGDPIGDHKAGEKLIWQLRETADKLGKQSAFYAIWEEFLPTYLDMGCAIMKIGEVARVDLQKFTFDGSAKKDFRYAKSKAEREGYKFEVIDGMALEPVINELHAISDAWLEIKNGEEKEFALGKFDDDYLRNFDHAILRHVESGKIVAFANLFQSSGNHELSLDLMRYDPAGPGFAMDALFAELLMWGQKQGFKWFSLGAAPFSGMQSHHLATLWNRVGSYIFEHGEHFYHFEGLRDYKQKFDPVWAPNYIAISRGASAPRILYEVNGLISGGVKGLIG